VDFNRPSIRFFLVLVSVALPPLVAFALISAYAAGWLADRGIATGTQLLVGAGVTVGWAALVAIVASRMAAGEANSILEIVERGAGSDSDSDSMSAMQRRLTLSLEERNRQIATLAEVARDAPITNDAVAVTRSMAAAARSLTADPTWILVVLRAPESALPVGTYDPGSPTVHPVDEVHRWASTLEHPAGGSGAQHALGPWGGFVVINVAAGDDLRAILMAPWEGRPPPSPAELSLFTLLGQHAATAIEHALLYARLRYQKEELDRLAHVQSDFLRGVTHDLQTPLTSIGAVASELRTSSNLDVSARSDLESIIHQADRLRRMVGQLLTVSRLEAGAIAPRSDVFRVEPILRRTWEALRPDRRLEVLVEGEPHLAVGDPDRFEQVLWATLDNAVKYSAAGTVIRAHLSLSATDEQGMSSLVITDEGAGMEPDAVSHAFDQFYRSATARRLAPDGSGIGLYVARGLMRAMDGDMVIASQLGVGTSVTLTLPGEPSAEGSEAQPA
jgi:two-component system sensor histidine kinase KdpD